MKTVTVKASRQYDVTIGSGLLSNLGETMRRLSNAETVSIVSDHHVFPIYGDTVKKSLADAGYHICEFVFQAGENSKNPSVYLELLNFLANNGVTRKDCILALGGGVTGDLAGFAAATFLRGIDYVQVPTSLLAMVDSSVGGKTGIDLPGGKNLCGAFWQPLAVICDTDTLRTLPDAYFRDGCAEVIKYAILFDPELFAHLEEKGLSFQTESVISRCVTWKRDVVAADEFDRGQRMLLNLGHTIGHAIESASEYSISHGNAVAIGMAMVAKSSHCPDFSRIHALLQQFHLPCGSGFSAEVLFHAALSDKKRNAHAITLIIPKAIGCCHMVPIPLESLKTFIEEGM